MNASGDNKGKKDNKKKEQAPKKEQPKKAEKKEEAPAAVAEPKPVKEKDPFAAMPAGSFVMDEWKKMFSNNPEVRPIFHRNYLIISPIWYQVTIVSFKSMVKG